MQLLGMSFNLMTLGGIAAAIGLVIDDAIVVVEAIYTQDAWPAWSARRSACRQAIGEIFRPLIGSTLTPVVVFIPLAFLDGITGVFFRALALTMVVSLLTSLVLAVTLTPPLAAWLMRGEPSGRATRPRPRGRLRLLRRVVPVYERRAARWRCGHRWITLGVCAADPGAGGAILYARLDSDFLPPMDEGGFVIDYVAPPGTSLAETNRQLHAGRGDPAHHAGGRELLAPHRGAAGAVDRRAEHRRLPGQAQAGPRAHAPRRSSPSCGASFNAAVPGVEWEFPGHPRRPDRRPDVVAQADRDQALLDRHRLPEARGARESRSAIKKVRGVVDTFDGLVDAGSTLSLRVRPAGRRSGSA